MMDAKELVKRIRALPRARLLAFDVDGTLAPIVELPGDARVPSRTRRALRRLAEKQRVAFVTGRDLGGLRKVLGPVPGAWRAVEHGGWVVPPGVRARRPAPSDEERARLQAFATFVRATPGRLETKPRAMALHVRGLDGATQAALLARAARRAKRLGLHVRHGRAVLEAELAPGDKGEALQELHARTKARAVFFAGDDLTDMPAIRYATANGLGVFVASEERRSPRGVPIVPNVEVFAEAIELLAGF
ncbi:MAG: trehalose-phosphatase [Sandaracinus sp.]|nr:trehalose-phosphatase [Sandaracinus sp.]MCB9614770.1 trehalose-phosphatase [Sandaracinus sp.]MCB9636351.1 trehalose-phosphatase [Sandaracinus sp.]